MKDARQYTINFDEWDIPAPDTRPLTPAGGADMRSAALRAKVTEEAVRNQPFQYMSFGSGSSGNACYIGSQRGGVIVDCGVNPDVILPALRANGVGPEKILAVLLTHDHTDHVKYAYKLLRTLKAPRLYCTNRVLNAVLRRHNVSKRIKDYHQPIFKEFPFKVGEMEITAFDVPHDAADNAGFCFQLGSRRFVMATDLGEVSERARYYMKEADFLMIEANYDLDMLRHGPYPEYLKARIQTSIGHMDNAATAAFLAEEGWTHLRHIFLCHLSADNNRPEVALSAIRAALEGRGLTVGAGEETLQDRSCDVQLVALPRFAPTRWHILR